MQADLAQLVNLLDLEEIEQNHYLGHSPEQSWQRVYGGQVVGQALVAAGRTVPNARLAHSLHACFLRPGDTQRPILYQVDRIRDGRSFTTRRVLARQRGRPIFNMSISFQVSEAGFDHQQPMPTVPPPEDLPDSIDLISAQAADLPAELVETLTQPGPIETRPITHWNALAPEPRAARQLCWMRTRDRLPDVPQLHQCALAYLSDWTLLDTATYPHGLSYINPQLQEASLDHAMWFHRPFRADEWLLYVQNSPRAGGARGFSRGVFYSRAGELVASATQEGLIRLHKAPPA